MNTETKHTPEDTNLCANCGMMYHTHNLAPSAHKECNDGKSYFKSIPDLLKRVAELEADIESAKQTVNDLINGIHTRDAENKRLREALEKTEFLNKWHPTNGDYQPAFNSQILVWDDGSETVKSKIFTGGWARSFTFWKPLTDIPPTEALKTNSDEA